MIPHLNDICWGIALVYQVQLFAKRSRLLLGVAHLQNAKVPRNASAVEETSELRHLVSTLDAFVVLDGLMFALPLSPIGAGAATLRVNGGVVLRIAVIIVATFALAANSLLRVVMSAVSSKSHHSKGARLLMTTLYLVGGHQRQRLRDIRMLGWRQSLRKRNFPSPPSSIIAQSRRPFLTGASTASSCSALCLVPAMAFISVFGLPEMEAAVLIRSFVRGGFNIVFVSLYVKE